MAEQFIQTPFGDFYAAEHDLIASHLAAYGAHNIADLQTFLSLIREGDTVVDIGAHIGTYAIAASKAAAPGGAVIAFEAFAPTFALLQRNIDNNRAAVKAVYAAIDNEKRTYAVHTAAGNSGATKLAQSAHDNDENGVVIPVITDIRPYSGERIDVMKIDVEGMEANVIDAIAEVLETDRPALMIEISRAELASRGHSCEEIGARLKSLGYQFFMNKAPRTMECKAQNLIEIPGLWVCGAQADILCVHRDSPRQPPYATRNTAYLVQLLLTPQHMRARIVALAKRYTPKSLYGAVQNLKSGAHRSPDH